MYKKTKVNREFEETHKYCDICGVEIQIGLACSAARCQICRKDLCENCIGKECSTSGDYRDMWCKNCWSIGLKYLPTIEYFESKIEALYQKWHAECKGKQINGETT